MPSKSKIKKTSAPKKKVVRSKAKINLLKHLNAILLVTGFAISLFTVFLLSNRSDNYDVRSRGQVLPSAAPSIALPSGGAGIPSNVVCAGVPCPSGIGNPAPSGAQEDEEKDNSGPGKGGQDQNGNKVPGGGDDKGGNKGPGGGGQDDQEEDGNKGHGNDEDKNDANNPGNGAPNANNPDQGGFMQQLMQMFQQLIQQITQLFGGGAPVPAPVPNENNQNVPSPAVSAAPQVSATP